MSSAYTASYSWTLLTGRWSYGRGVTMSWNSSDTNSLISLNRYHCLLDHFLQVAGHQTASGSGRVTFLFNREWNDSWSDSTKCLTPIVSSGKKWKCWNFLIPSNFLKKMPKSHPTCAKSQTHLLLVPQNCTRLTLDEDVKHPGSQQGSWLQSS